RASSSSELARTSISAFRFSLVNLGGSSGSAMMLAARPPSKLSALWALAMAIPSVTGRQATCSMGRTHGLVHHFWKATRHSSSSAVNFGFCRWSFARAATESTSIDGAWRRAASCRHRTRDRSGLRHAITYAELGEDDLGVVGI